MRGHPHGARHGWLHVPQPAGLPGTDGYAAELGLATELAAAIAEVLLASAVGASWVYYRTARCVSRPLADITRNRDGIPFLAPEVVLLFKSRSTSDKDQRDVETALPVLNAEQRSWLQDTLEHLPRGQTAPVHTHCNTLAISPPS
jgi:hypothetical protein